MRVFVSKILFLVVFIVSAITADSARAEGDNADAPKVRLIVEDAERFATLFASGGDGLGAQSLQTHYLDQGTPAIEIFTPGRIKNAENLAKKIAANPELYARGIEVCLPAARAVSPDLRAIYQAYEGLLDSPKLPEAYAVFGANNTGGTIGGSPGDFSLVLGLEVICRVAEGGVEDVRQWFRNYLAHEVAHTQQSFTEKPTLLSQILLEGGAEFIGSLIAGQSLNDELDAWAREREEDIWRKFEQDINNPEFKGFSPWLYKGKPENGWPMDVGYWFGARIAASYYEKASDKRQAIKDILAAGVSAEAFYKASGYSEKFK